MSFVQSFVQHLKQKAAAGIYLTALSAVPPRVRMPLLIPPLRAISLSFISAQRKEHSLDHTLCHLPSFGPVNKIISFNSTNAISECVLQSRRDFGQQGNSLPKHTLEQLMFLNKKKLFGYNKGVDSQVLH